MTMSGAGNGGGARTTLDEKLVEEGDLHLKGNFHVQYEISFLGWFSSSRNVKELTIGKYNGVLKYRDEKGILKILSNGSYSIKEYPEIPQII